jgi:2-polyprenyl-3-methyl-5-hydroxy-6-metoxy-1,4-benzoquinol methylase
MSADTFNPSVFLGGSEAIRKIQRKFADLFHKGEAVLDLGCGDGIFLELLRDRGVRGIGVDSFPACVESCRRNGLTVHQSDILQFLQQAEGPYDGVFCSHIVEHLSPTDVLTLIHHSRRVMRSGGRMIIVTPNPKDIEVITERFWLDITHVRPYPIPLLEKMLEHAGFAVVRSGLDRDSRTLLIARNPLKMVRKVMKKLRWGSYWGKGDEYVVARVPETT